MDSERTTRRGERRCFAMGSLLYEALSGTAPFEDLADEEVRRRFRDGDFLQDAASFPMSIAIYSGWSSEFEQ